MTDQTPSPPSGEATAPVPGERRLARPPSDRYRREPVDEPPSRPTSTSRGLAYAALVAVVGAVAITVMGGVLTLTGGLVVTAAVIGIATGWAVRMGAGTSLTPRRRSEIAVVVSLIAVLAGQVGLWLYAQSEGGVLPLLDYLGQVFGPLVPLQVAIAPIAAWMAAR